MRDQTQPAMAIGAGIVLWTVAGCSAPNSAASLTSGGPERGVDRANNAVVITSDTPRPPFEFETADEALLDEIQRASFGYLWDAVAPQTGMVLDRSSSGVVSVAGVGFQLSAIPIAIERGWIEPEIGEGRAYRILNALESNPDNRHRGLFYHYLDGATAGPTDAGYERVISTIDSALLFAGITVVAAYFDGEVSAIGDRLIDGADWSAYVLEDGPRPFENGFVSLAWKPDTQELVEWVWADAGDEHRLVTFLGVCAPDADHRLPPEDYYRLRRTLGTHNDLPMVWFPWSGALFTSFFAHCWIDYAHLGVDDPGAFGQEHRASVDWWENARRTALMHRDKCAENPWNLASFGPDRWGVGASDAPDGYRVPGFFPDPLPMTGRPHWDYTTATPDDAPGDGTLAPYAAGSCVMFTPAESVAALRAYRNLRAPDGSPLVWRDPVPTETWGFQDAFNLDGHWVAEDGVAIDHGPLVLAIENARTGRVWEWFHEHPSVKDGLRRLKLERE